MASVKNYGLAVGISLGLTACVVEADNRHHHDNDGGGGGTVVVEEHHDEYHDDHDHDHDHDHDGGGRGGRYSNLPDRGFLDQYMPNGFTNASYVLEAGRYQLRGGNWHSGGDNLTIQGAGIGQTVIFGNMLLKGNNYVLRDMTIEGNFELHGNNCTLGLDFKGSKTVKGFGTQFVTSTPPPAYVAPPPPPPVYNPPPPPPVYVAPPPPPPPVVFNPPPPPPADPNFLPDRGYLDQYMTNGFNNAQYVLEPGIYALRKGKFDSGGGNLTIQGAGIGKTIIKGNMLLKGNNYVIRGITLRGDFELHGNNCTLNIDFKGSKTVKGTGTQFLTGDR
jgi:hypothetical protein